MSTKAKSNSKKKIPKNKKKAPASRTIRDEDGNVVPRPWNQYTIFFRLEAIYIRQIENGVVDDDVKAELDLAPNYYDPIEHPRRPDKYRDLVLPPCWYSSAQRLNSEKERKHKRKDGRIGLKELHSMISARWKTADDCTKAYVNELARYEASKYKELVDSLSLLMSNKKAFDIDSDSNDEESEEVEGGDGGERLSPYVYVFHGIGGDSFARIIQPTPMIPRAGRNLELKPTTDRHYREYSYEWQESNHHEASASQNYQGHPSESNRRYYYAYGENTRSMQSSSMNTCESEYLFRHDRHPFQFRNGRSSPNQYWFHDQPPMAMAMAMASLVAVPSWSEGDANCLMNALFDPEPEANSNSNADDGQRPASI